MYQLPIWSHKPSKCREGEWYIEEIKNGIVVSKHILNVPVTTFGRIPLHQLLPQDPPSSPSSDHNHGDDGSLINSERSNLYSNNNDDSGVHIQRSTVTSGRRIAYKSVITAHESCSRLHARIAFDSTGTPWLRDLGSGNGTTVNKKNLPVQSIGKEEEVAHVHVQQHHVNIHNKPGSRGVIIYPGDVIQFGASTRIYVLNGPSYFDRGAMKARKQQQQQQLQNIKEGIQNNNDDVEQGISWGIDFDTSENKNEQESNSSSSYSSSYLHQPTMNNSIQVNLDDPSTIPDKHRKIYDKLQSKKYKLQNIQTEMRRIQAKAVTVELSSGQLSQLEKNEKQERLLEEEIQKMINELEMKLNNSSTGRNVGPTGRKSMKRNIDEMDGIYNDDDVDDFYDRTSSKRSISNSILNDSETIGSLTAKWNILVSKLHSIQHFITKAQQKVDEIEKEIQETKKANNNNGDDECFFLQNDLDIANDQYKKIQKDETQMNNDLDSTEKMILIIDDKMVFDRELKFIGFQSDLDAFREQKRREMEATKEIDMMPPPSLPPPKRKLPVALKQFSGKKRDDGHYELMPPPPPMMMLNNSGSSISTTASKQLRCPTMPTEQLPKANNDLEKDNNNSTTRTSTLTTSTIGKKRHRKQGPMRPPLLGTLQALQQASTININSSTTNQNQRHQTKTLKGTKSISSSSSSEKDKDDLNPKVDQWVAPKGQDGSGVTKLNAKFQGRY